MPKIILFIGVPGSGKGSRGKICEEHGYVHISSSRLLKDAGYNLQNSRNIPNKVIIELIKKVISKQPNDATIILEGFPRRMEQVELVEKEIGIDKAIYLKISKSNAFKRVENRIACSNCGESYTTNLYKMPKNEGVCDKCNGVLIKRPSDNKEVFERRYRFFVKFTYPVITYYSNLGKLITVDALRPNEEIITVIDSL